jgi:long-chain acyl-CoA synthetase
MADAGKSAADARYTFPKYLELNARTRPGRPAMRWKDLGIWQTWTWRDVHDEVRALSIGMRLRGIAKGERVAIIGRNRPRLYWGMMAAQALGAVPVPVYADAVADEMAYVLEHAEVRAAIVEDQELVDKIPGVTDRLPELKDVIYDDVRGLRDYDHGHLVSIDDVQRAGRDAVARDAGVLTASEAGVAAGTGAAI